MRQKFICSIARTTRARQGFLMVIAHFFTCCLLQAHGIFTLILQRKDFVHLQR